MNLGYILMSQRLSEFFEILEFRLHIGKAHKKIILVRFSLVNLTSILNLCEVWDVDLRQRILKIFILVTYSMSQLVIHALLPDNYHYRVDYVMLPRWLSKNVTQIHFLE